MTTFPRFMSAPGVARTFGVTPETAVRWIRAGRFGDYLSRASKNGRERLSVRVSAVEAYIARETRRATDPEAAGAEFARERFGGAQP